MLLMNCHQVKKYFGDRLIFHIDHLKVYSEDRIGIVGTNGVGKTTLINVLSQRLKPDEGQIKLYGKAAYISQMEAPDQKKISNEKASRFGVNKIWDERMSGGEKTRFKIAEALDGHSVLLLADEPTSNLDMEGIQLVEEKFKAYKGALMIISHDRQLLNQLCNQILEVEDGRIKIYKGNYDHYKHQKMKEEEREQFEYEAYIKEKKRLEKAIQGTKEKEKSIRRTPKRMGNSEARLHKMGSQKEKAKLNRAVQNIEKRIEHLEVKEKPKEKQSIKLDGASSDQLHSKIIIKGKHIDKAFGEHVIFKKAAFNIYNGSKVALIGPNGCGKSTLIKMIKNNENGIEMAQKAKIGYFSQDMDILKKDLSIIENVMAHSIYPENFARLLLARLLFKGEEIYKKINILSGGERVKISFAKILLEDINLLILDEPTNYMDVNALEVIEEMLKNYERTLLFVSHDRQFINAIADHIMTIENQKIKMFMGSYNEYLEQKNKSTNALKEKAEKQKMVLENRLSEIIGRLSMPSKNDNIEALDKEYYEILDVLKRLK